MSRYDKYLENPNIQGLLTGIRYGEGTSDPEKGYRTMFGGGTFDDFSRHPDTVVHGNGYSSAAAGAYQFMPDTWAETSKALGLSDFSPRSQDLGALYLIERRGVNLDKIAERGFDADDIAKLAPEWASLPTKEGKSYYGQPVKSFDEIAQAARNPIRPKGARGGASGVTPPKPSGEGIDDDALTRQLLKQSQAILQQGQQQFGSLLRNQQAQLQGQLQQLQGLGLQAGTANPIQAAGLPQVVAASPDVQAWGRMMQRMGSDTTSQRNFNPYEAPAPASTMMESAGSPAQRMAALSPDVSAEQMKNDPIQDLVTARRRMERLFGDDW